LVLCAPSSGFEPERFRFVGGCSFHWSYEGRWRPVGAAPVLPPRSRSWGAAPGVRGDTPWRQQRGHMRSRTSSRRVSTGSSIHMSYMARDRPLTPQSRPVSSDQQDSNLRLPRPKRGALPSWAMIRFFGSVTSHWTRGCLLLLVSSSSGGAGIEPAPPPVRGSASYTTRRAGHRSRSRYHPDALAMAEANQADWYRPGERFGRGRRI
jgi:hypothetical protein